MHSLVRRYLKTAIAFLLVGLALGGWMMVRRDIFAIFPNPYEVSAHTHALLVGFVMLMIQGVALWLFPRPERGDERYRPELAGAAYRLVTLGTAVRIAGELLHAGVTARWLAWTIVTAGFAQGGGILLFFYTMWTRIRPAGSREREAKGEKF